MALQATIPLKKQEKLVKGATCLLHCKLMLA